MIETSVFKLLLIFSMEFPSLKKSNHFSSKIPLFTEKAAFPEMLTRILNEHMQFKNHLLNIYQASGLFED